MDSGDEFEVSAVSCGFSSICTAVSISGAKRSRARWEFGGILRQPGKDLIEDGLPAVPDQDQRPPVDAHSTIIRFHIRQISVSVPGPPGRAKAASHSWIRQSQPLEQAFAASILPSPSDWRGCCASARFLRRSRR